MPNDPMPRCWGSSLRSGTLRRGRELRIRFLCEPYPDGFPVGEPEWLAYCPRLGVMRRTLEHQVCSYCQGTEVDENGVVTAVYCRYPEMG
jgi:hypothetical protein